MKNIPSLILAIFLVTGCEKDDSQNFRIADEIIFGESYGMCMGDCRNLYLLTGVGIYKDSNVDSHVVPEENTTFESEALPKQNFNLAQSLLRIPPALMESDDEIGNQTMADFDYFIHVRVNGQSKTWKFDELKGSTPSEIEEYIEKLIQVNAELSE